MRIGIVANDTRGGVQPYVALGVGLKRAGHAVALAAPSDFTDMIADHGLTPAPLSGSVEAVVRASGGAAGGPLRSMRLVVRELGARLSHWTMELLSACQDVDVITGGIGGMVVGLPVAERLGKPFIESHLQPTGLVTSRFPGVLFPRAPRWPGVWPLSHHLSHLALWTLFEMAMARVRKEQLNLPARAPPRRNPIVYGFSRHVLPPLPQHDRARYVTGYWTLPEPDFTPPAELERFLATADPVVSIGFGSMAGAEGDATAEVLKAIRSVGVKAVLLTGWGGLADGGGAEDVFADSLVAARLALSPDGRGHPPRRGRNHRREPWSRRSDFGRTFRDGSALLGRPRCSAGCRALAHPTLASDCGPLGASG